MFSKAKYVVGIPKSCFASLPQAIVIPETMAHVELRDLFVEGSITSAGFFAFDQDRVYVHGISVSLKTQSLPSDEKLVGRAIAHPKYSI